MSEPSLSTFLINILGPDHTSEDLDELEELAHRAFTLAEQHPASTSSEISPDMSSGVLNHRFAMVFYPSGAQNGDMEFSPVKAILQQNPPSRPARVVVDFQTRAAVCEDQEANLAIEPEQIEHVREYIKLQMQGVWECNWLKSHADWTVSS